MVYHKQWGNYSFKKNGLYSLYTWQARSAYLQYMVDILLVLGVNDSVANEEMTKVMEFETELEKVKSIEIIVVHWHKSPQKRGKE